MNTDHIRKTLSTIEGQVDEVRRTLKRRLGLMDPLKIQPYRTWRTDEELWIKGRVLEDKGIDVDDEPTKLENIRKTWHRYESDEMPGARLRAEIGESRHRLTTNEEGFFELRVPASDDLEATDGWLDVPLTLESPLIDDQEPHHTQARLLTVSPEARFGVISDMDDTVIRTGATDFLKRLRVELFHNAHSREAFPGVQPFYQALSQSNRNPFFYVSSSAWNLFDLFEKFLEVHEIPLGPILLKEMGLTDQHWLKSGHDDYKVERVSQIMDAFPELGFVLVGDSGQRDPFIYREVVRRYPDRIKAIYIRDVSDDAKDAEVRKVRDELAEQGVDLLLLPHTLAAARHAADLGLIETQAVDRVAKASLDQ